MRWVNSTASGRSTENGFSDFLKSSLTNGLGIHVADTSSSDYSIEISSDGVTVIPYYPVDRPIDYDFYKAVYKVLSVAAYPYYTVLKSSGLQLVPIKSDDYHNSRGLFFPWLKGIPKRKVWTGNQYFDEIKHCLATNSKKIPLMENFDLDVEKTTHIAISGQSGSGKSYLVRYQLPFFLAIGDLTLIDPKADDLLLWGKSDLCSALEKITGRSAIIEYPDLLGKTGTFLEEVTGVLDQEVDVMLKREDTYSKTGKRPFRHRFIVIDELLALTQGGTKKIVDRFFSDLSQLALLGRSAKMHLVLISQRFSAEAMPTSIRDQLQAVFQLGPISKNTTQFLLPDFDSEGVIPPRGKGTGICQVQGDVIPYPRPFLSPTYTNE